MNNNPTSWDELLDFSRPIEFYLAWHCGDRCCSNSQTLKYPAGTFQSFAQLVERVENESWDFGAIHEEFIRWNRSEYEVDPQAQYLMYEEE